MRRILKYLIAFGITVLASTTMKEASTSLNSIEKHLTGTQGAAVSVELGLESALTPASATPVASYTPEPTQTATPEPFTAWLDRYGLEASLFDDYTENQKAVYLEMDESQVEALLHMLKIDSGITAEKYVPASLELLSAYLSGFGSFEKQKIMYNHPGAPQKNQGAENYIIGFSDDLAPHWALLWKYIAEEKAGLSAFIVDNSESNSSMYVDFMKEYSGSDNGFFHLGSLFHDQVLALEENNELSDMTEKEIAAYVRENGFPDYLNDLDHDQVLAAVAANEAGEEDAIFMTFIGHMHLKHGVLMYNYGYTENYDPQQFLPEEFLAKVDGRHLDITMITCDAGFMNKLIRYIEDYNDNLPWYREGISLTLKYSSGQGDNYRTLPLEQYLTQSVMAYELLEDNAFTSYNDFRRLGELRGAEMDERNYYFDFTLPDFDGVEQQFSEVVAHSPSDDHNSVLAPEIYSTNVYNPLDMLFLSQKLEKMEEN